ncbi:MAG: AlpA family phage regulatory protein [Glaciecola sp.]|nr:AlpA family phage regulatory protein [Glaciecola sp.]MDG1816688.1 AlpA family phage regulatory protein [Glaciecola sp.]MDG2099160.1 AlpA family phage regulatory protein [Glaciecola sp.]
MSHSDEDRIIRIKETKHISGFSKSYIYQLEQKGLFPKRIPLVDGGTAVGWLESEVYEWLNSRIKQRDEEAA